MMADWCSTGHCMPPMSVAVSVSEPTTHCSWAWQAFGMPQSQQLRTHNMMQSLWH